MPPDACSDTRRLAVRVTGRVSSNAGLCIAPFDTRPVAMRVARGVWRTRLTEHLLVEGLHAGCSSPDTYACQSQAQCGPEGTCEPAGYCSFPADDCPSAARYGEWAPPELAGSCVEPSNDAGGSSGGVPDDGESSTGGSPETSETGIDDPVPVTTGPPPDPTTGGIPVCGDGMLDPDRLTRWRKALSAA